jgi:predicted transcriptional regulator
MAGPSVTAERIQWAVDRLLECRSTSAVVSQLSEREGLSRRQSQRIVGRAHAVLVEDLEEAGVDRQQIVAQIEHGLMEALGKALASSQPAAVVGAARELRELLHLTGGVRPDHFGRFGKP